MLRRELVSVQQRYHANASVKTLCYSGFLPLTGYDHPGELQPETEAKLTESQCYCHDLYFGKQCVHCEEADTQKEEQTVCESWNWNKSPRECALDAHEREWSRNRVGQAMKRFGFKEPQIQAVLRLRRGRVRWVRSGQPRGSVPVTWQPYASSGTATTNWFTRTSGVRAEKKTSSPVVAK